MAEIHELATNYDIELRLTRVKAGVKALLRRDSVIDRLGESRIYGNVYEAAADQIPDTPGTVRITNWYHVPSQIGGKYTIHLEIKNLLLSTYLLVILR